MLISHLFEKLSLLLLSQLISSLQVSLVLRLHGLHVDLQPQFGVLCGLQLVLQLLQLRLHLLQLLLHRALRLLQIVHLRESEKP